MGNKLHNTSNNSGSARIPAPLQYRSSPTYRWHMRLFQYNSGTSDGSEPAEARYSVFCVQTVGLLRDIVGWLILEDCIALIYIYCRITMGFTRLVIKRYPYSNPDISPHGILCQRKCALEIHRFDGLTCSHVYKEFDFWRVDILT